MDSGRYDRILNLITQEQLDTALYRLLVGASEEDLKSAIGRVNGPRVHSEIRRILNVESDNFEEERTTLDSFN